MTMNTATELTVQNIAGVYIRKVKPFGTNTQVDCPKEHLGKTLYMVLVNE